MRFSDLLGAPDPDRGADARPGDDACPGDPDPAPPRARSVIGRPPDVPPLAELPPARTREPDPMNPGWPVATGETPIAPSGRSTSELEVAFRRAVASILDSPGMVGSSTASPRREAPPDAAARNSVPADPVPAHPARPDAVPPPPGTLDPPAEQPGEAPIVALDAVVDDLLPPAPRGTRGARRR